MNHAYCQISEFIFLFVFYMCIFFLSLIIFSCSLYMPICFLSSLTVLLLVYLVHSTPMIESQNVLHAVEKLFWLFFFPVTLQVFKEVSSLSYWPLYILGLLDTIRQGCLTTQRGLKFNPDKSLISEACPTLGVDMRPRRARHDALWLWLWGGPDKNKWFTLFRYNECAAAGWLILLGCVQAEDVRRVGSVSGSLWSNTS